MGVLLRIAYRNLVQARRRTTLLSLAVGLVTMLLVVLLSISRGIEDNLVKAATTGELPPLLRFDDAERFADLYAPERRYDETHLNDEGARLFTEKLADEFIARVKRGELAPR